MKYILLATILLLVGCGQHNKMPQCIQTDGTANAYVEENSTDDYSWFKEVKCLSESDIMKRSRK